MNRTACILLLFPLAASAAEVDPETRANGQLYLHSIGLPKEAKVCERHIPGYGAIFQPLYDSWRARNEPFWAKALALMEAEAAKQGRSMDDIARQVTDDAIAKLAVAQEDTIWQTCILRLLALRKPTSRFSTWSLEPYRGD